MNGHLEFWAGPDLPPWPLADGLTGQAQAAVAEAPDLRLGLIDEAGKAVAHAALWWRDTPPHAAGKVGAIGGFDAVDRGAARRLLEAACVRLRDEGCALAVGPMNGNTWRRHRFVVESDGRGPFLLEPRNPEDFPGWWRDAGFSELSRYSSSVMPLENVEPVPGAVAKRLERSGIALRKLDAARLPAELAAIHALSLRSFAPNFLYTPLDRDEFVAGYAKLGDRLDPDLVLLAERGGELCGFVFTLPDLEAAARGERPAVIVKTLAVDPAARCGGLGSLLVSKVHHIAREKGFSEAIHALQHESNTSLKITGRHGGNVFRRYALFSLPL